MVGDLLRRVLAASAIAWTLGVFGGLFIILRNMSLANGVDPLTASSSTGYATLAFLAVWLVASAILSVIGVVFLIWLQRQIEV